MLLPRKAEQRLSSLNRQLKPRVLLIRNDVIRVSKWD